MAHGMKNKDAKPSTQELREQIRKELDELDIPEHWRMEFNGFGGSDPKFETKVYSVVSVDENNPFHFEIRIPMDPVAFPPEAVEREYNCRSALTLQEASEDLAEALDGAD